MRDKGNIRLSLITATLWAATAGPARAAADPTDPVFFLPLLLALLAGLIAGFALKRPKIAHPTGDTVLIEGNGSAYCQIDSKDGSFSSSPYLQALVKSPKPIRQLEQLSPFFVPASMRELEQAVEQSRLGKPVPVLSLAMVENEQFVEARIFTRVNPKGEVASLVVWFFNVSDKQRQQQRLAQENEKLKNDLKHYSTIINMAPYPIWQRDASLNVRFYNLSYNEAVSDDADRADTEGTPELDKKVTAMARIAMDTGKPVSERHHIVVGGERRLYQITEMPVPQEKMLVGFAIDMTEIELLKEELTRHVSAQDDLLESSASAMAIYGADMRLKSFNYAFVSLWKMDEVWLDTQPLYSEILEVLREKSKLPEQANFQQFKQQQVKMFTDLIAPREEFFYLPDGKALRVIAIPHALGGILFAYEDVTDRLALERSYNTLIAVQRETLDNLHEGVAVFGEDGRLRLCNPGYLKLWHLDADLAQSEPHITDIVERCKALFVYEDWASFKQMHIEQIQVREYRARRLERSDGKVIDWRKVPLPDGATLITHSDVTDSTLVEQRLRERNEALQEADSLKTEFLANVSYELRSPLTSISGFSEMLRQEYFGSLSEKQKEYVEGIHQSSQHLMQLINDILDLASVEAGYMRLEVSKFDIAVMMKSVLSLIQERVKEHNITVKVECPSKIGKMTGDETRIKQIMFNLLSNAIKYSKSGQTIKLGAKEVENDQIMLWVEDEGQGVPLEEQAAIFNKFYKGKKQETTKSKAGRSGTGLGLSIVKSFIELHGGRVELHSEPGQGARFECYLQRNNPDLKETTKPKKAA